jgi:hypothetical protein
MTLLSRDESSVR